MGLLNELLGAATQNGGTANAGIGTMLLGLLASESGAAPGARNGAPTPEAAQSPAAVSGGMQELVQRFERGGLGDVVQSWIGSGGNRPITPDALHDAVGSQTFDRLAQQTGIGKSALLPLLAQALPLVIDRLTPQGRIPSEAELGEAAEGRTLQA